jgi:hypothetical protein
MNATNELLETRKKSNRTNVVGVDSDVDEEVDRSSDGGTSMLNDATNSITGTSAREQNEIALHALQHRLRAEKTVEECISIEALAFEEDPIGTCVRSF